MFPCPWLRALTGAALVGFAVLGADPTPPPAPAPLTTPTWGRITPSTHAPQVLRAEVAQWPADGRLALPPGTPPLVGATRVDPSQSQPVAWTVDPSTRQQTLLLPTNAPAARPVLLDLEVTPPGQLADGRILFTAREAQVHGSTTRVESPGGLTWIGTWGTPQDVASWDFKPTRWGRYEVQAVVSTGMDDGSDMVVGVAGETVTRRLPATGASRPFQAVTLGSFYLAKSDPFTVQVACRRPTGRPDVQLLAVVLRPAPEGAPSMAEADGSITLRAANATTHSVRMRYEPADIKNCLGYWVETSDWADWTFQVPRPGVFDVEVWQGCGKGQGGSDVAVEVAGRMLEFQVEDTGHFQAFLPRRVGRVELGIAGPHRLAIRPQRKAAGAIMDIRQIRLIPVAAEPHPSPLSGRRVVVVGDSITYGGEWVEFAEALLRWRHPEAAFDWINVGLPSETASGLSEAGHAGGAFPRPGVHERLGRVLEKARPDVVVACYGMNDGIYHPYSEERAAAFRSGIERLRERAMAAGAQVIVVTPPPFDPVPLKGRTLPAGLDAYPSPYVGYDEVLGRYSEWLVGQRAKGWQVVDVHGPMNAYLAERRRTEPGFVLAGDGVHASTVGHWLMARELVQSVELPAMLALPETPETLGRVDARFGDILRAVQARQRVQKDAWLTAIGHVRPGMSRGQPLAVAQEAAVRLAADAQAAASLEFPGRVSRWHGFDRKDFPVDGKMVTVVMPPQPAAGRPWAWHGEFFGHKPAPDIALLARGFHVVYVSVPDLLGAPPAVQAWDRVYERLTTRHGLNAKPALVGLSRGGLYCYNWAIAHPDRVACIYGDAPVCDFRSWPGAFGEGKRSDRDWELVLKHYGFKDDAEARAYPRNPVDALAGLAAAKVPLLHVYGDADEVVPWKENTGKVAERYRALGGSITLIAKPGVKHHPHGLEDSTPIVDFLWRHAAPEAQAALDAGGKKPVLPDGRP